MNADELAHRFKHHPPKHQVIADQHQVIRQEMHLGADLFNNLLPECREKSLAITKLEEAMFWANAALARNQQVEGVDYVFNGDGERVKITWTEGPVE